jgi:2-polyprenyl-3-methyl-5-hydroxy-6-metoxy-1,4-benzoquinol methylase
MNSTFWDTFFDSNEYAYGEHPNDFLRENAQMFKGKVLCLAEGEGRNAVFLASNGCEVTCIDFSEMALAKARDLAKKKGCTIECICADLSDVDFGNAQWDGIVMIFGHLPPLLRAKVHGAFFKALKPGGKVLIEAYDKDQLPLGTGGPKTLEMLYSAEDLAHDFKAFDNMAIQSVKREIHEGSFHNGKSSVLQVLLEK